jgi:hypothetical protein
MSNPSTVVRTPRAKTVPEKAPGKVFQDKNMVEKIAMKLPIEQVLSTCSTVPAFGLLCQDSGFWERYFSQLSGNDLVMSFRFIKNEDNVLKNKVQRKLLEAILAVKYTVDQQSAMGPRLEHFLRFDFKKVSEKAQLKLLSKDIPNKGKILGKIEFHQLSEKVQMQILNQEETTTKQLILTGLFYYYRFEKLSKKVQIHILTEEEIPNRKQAWTDTIIGSFCQLHESVQRKLLEEKHEGRTDTLYQLTQANLHQLSEELQLELLNEIFVKELCFLHFPRWELHELKSGKVQMHILTNGYNKSDIVERAFPHFHKLSKEVQLHILQKERNIYDRAKLLTDVVNYQFHLLCEKVQLQILGEDIAYKILVLEKLNYRLTDTVRQTANQLLSQLQNSSPAKPKPLTGKLR